jgi:hypothetical protein
VQELSGKLASSQAEVEASKAEVAKLTKHVEDLASRAATARFPDTQGGEEVGGGSRISSSRQRSLIETRIEDGVRTLVNVPRSLVRGARALPLLQVSKECVL